MSSASKYEAYVETLRAWMEAVKEKRSFQEREELFLNYANARNEYFGFESIFPRFPVPELPEAQS